MRKLIFILSLFTMSIKVFGQVSASAGLDKASILIGDQVNLTVTMQPNAGVVLEGVDFSILEKDENIDLIKQGALLQVKNSKSGLYSQQATISVFDSGYFKIQALPVIFELGGRKDTIFTNDLALQVETMPVSSDSLQVMPNKDIIPEPLSFEDAIPFLISAGVTIALLGLIYYMLKRKKKKVVPPKPKPVIPAHVTALEKLEKLRREKLWQQGEIKAYESQLTYILWEYLEKRYDIKAIEATTDEILRDVRQLDIKDEWKLQLGDIFRTADLVKFAKAKPPETIYDQVMDQVVKFVKGTKKIITDSESAPLETQTLDQQ